LNTPRAGIAQQWPFRLHLTGSVALVSPSLTTSIPNVFSQAGQTDVQVNERVMGFMEQQGKRKTTFMYDPDSLYLQKPLVRLLETTGVLWHTDDASLGGETMNQAILSAFCSYCSIQENDLGIGTFTVSGTSLLWPRQFEQKRRKIKLTSGTRDSKLILANPPGLCASMPKLAGFCLSGSLWNI
jgi:hypothetical protein